jgi:protein gp37
MTTNIEWVKNPDGSKGETWNLVTGCTKASAGCQECYALKESWKKMHHPHPAIQKAYEGVAEKRNGKLRWTGRINLVPDRLEKPLHWRKQRRVFVCSMSDLFHEAIEILDSTFIRDVFAVMSLCREHTFQLLTKRPHVACLLLTDDFAGSVEWAADGICADKGWCPPEFEWPLPNVWFGITLENQETADERRAAFRAIPAAVKYVSHEPALGLVDWTGWEFVNQIISGGETGKNARPSHPNFHRAARDFCQANGIAYFFKAWGKWAPRIGSDDPDGRGRPMYPDGRFGDPNDWEPGPAMKEAALMYPVGKRRAGRLLDGRTWDQMPEVSQ